MAQRFIACDREQSFLMPPDVREWLPEGHFAWFVLDAVAGMDLEAFYAAYRADGRSRPAYEPAMMVALVLYAYARGMRSARAIERACVEDVAYRVIAAQQKPDHATHRALCRAPPGRAGGRVRPRLGRRRRARRHLSQLRLPAAARPWRGPRQDGRVRGPAGA
jgi:hypothetical protein